MLQKKGESKMCTDGSMLTVGFFSKCVDCNKKGLRYFIASNKKKHCLKKKESR